VDIPVQAFFEAPFIEVKVVELNVFTDKGELCSHRSDIANMI
jgi:hypothetical protein